MSAKSSILRLEIPFKRKKTHFNAKKAPVFAFKRIHSLDLKNLHLNTTKSGNFPF